MSKVKILSEVLSFCKVGYSVANGTSLVSFFIRKILLRMILWEELLTKRNEAPTIYATRDTCKGFDKVARLI